MLRNTGSIEGLSEREGKPWKHAPHKSMQLEPGEHHREMRKQSLQRHKRLGVQQVREQQTPGASASQGAANGSAQSNAMERAAAIRAPKYLSDLAIKRSSVTLAVAMGAVGEQEAVTEGVEAGKAGKALPQ